MPKYLISFDDGAMTFPEEELPAVAEAAHEEARMVATDGTVADGPYPERKQYLGGFAVVDVPSCEEALEWAAKIAVCPPRMP